MSPFSSIFKRMVPLLGVAVLCHVPLWFDASLPLQSLATLTLGAFLPGALLVRLLVGDDPNPAERVLLSAGTGYAVLVLGVLLLSYLPGGLERWQVLVLFDGLIAVLLILLITRPTSHVARGTNHAPGTTHRESRNTNYLLLAGVVALLLLGVFLRLTNLGYAEFHNDEARAALRAAAVLQGSEDVLLIHKKGPTEILIPAAIYAVAGRLDEAAARLPFALANVAGLFGVWLLGRQLFGPGRLGHVAGFTAALLLALDGYFIGFARIVQYQSVVFMSSALAVAIFARFQYGKTVTSGWTILAALLTVLGLLSHYEAGLVLLPLLPLLVPLLRRDFDKGVLRSLLIALTVGLALLALFYVPYLRHPQFSATYTYLAERRIGGADLPHNNLADVFLRTTVYSTTYYVTLLAVATLLGLAVAFRQGYGQRAARILTQAAAVLLILFVIRTDWFTVGGKDLAIVPFLLVFGLVWFVPKIRWEERTLWIWFGGLFILTIFGTLKPRTHVYLFFVPWTLLVGWTLARLWERLGHQFGEKRTRMAGTVGLLVVVGIFGNYAYRLFVVNQPEVLRTWSENRPRGYWTAYAEPEKSALFGFPTTNGWKVVGELYKQGVIVGNYETNELEAWGPAWYTRSQTRCKHDADWYFQTTANLEPFFDFQREAMEAFLGEGFQPWAIVEVNDVQKLIIHRRSDKVSESLPIFALKDYANLFDRHASPALPLSYPVVNPPIEHPLHVNLEHLFWLKGYNIEHPQPLSPGGTIKLTLFWSAQQPTNKTYKVFNQAYYGEGTMVAQKDGHPVCGNRDTWQWDPGELITDVHYIVVRDDAPAGLYPLVTGMYELESGARLTVLDESGNVVGNQVHLTDIRIETE